MTAPKTEAEDEPLREKYEAPMRELGPAEYVRNIQRTRPGKGDYTAERHNLLAGITFADIMAELERMRAAGGDQHNADEPGS